MNRLVLAVLAVVLFGAGSAAASSFSPSPLALPAVDAATGESFAQPPPPEGMVMEAEAPRTTYEATRYRPRRHREYREHYDRGPRREAYSQIHAGFLDPEGDRSPGFLIGFRAAAMLDPLVHLGGMIDWRHKSDRQTEVVSEGVGPGGEPIIVRREFSRSSSDLVPVMALLQVSAPADLGVIPYFGVGAGYEFFFLSAENSQTGESFEGTFGGFGWQAWGGVAVPLSGRARLVGEVFLNESEVARDVEDAITGENFRETINMDGAGMRFGLAWGF